MARKKAQKTPENAAYDARVTGAGEYSTVPEYGRPDSAYAAPDIHRDAPYNDEFGWGPKTRLGVESTPDAMREMSAPVRDVRPPGNQNPKPFYAAQSVDEDKRESVTDQDANGWNEKKDRYKIGPDPRWNPPAETRPTEKLSPRSYSFTRPFDQGTKGNGARTLNGMHFSMADHRREYEILGMKPWAQSRNTYRVDPAPWDADMYDVPPASTEGTYVNGRIQAVDVPYSNSDRSYRL